MDDFKIEKNIKLMQILNLLMDFKLYGAIAILYFTKITNSITLGMSIFSITMISAAIFEFPTGIFSDKYGRKKTIIIGTIASLIYSILFAIGENYKWLIFGAVFEGLERALFSGNNDSLIYDTLKENGKEAEYKHYLGKTNSMYYAAGILSSILGAIIVYFTSYKIIMYISIIPKIINIFVATKIQEPNVIIAKKEKILNKIINSIKETKNNKILVKQIIADSLSQGIGEATFQFRSKFYELVWPTWALGIPNAMANIGSFIGNRYAGKIIEKHGNKKTIIIGYIYSIISNIVAVITKNVISPIIMITNSIIPTGIATEEISQKLYKDEYRSSMGSIKSLFSSILYSIFALLVGIIADLTNVEFTIIIAQVIKIIVILIYINIFNMRKVLT